MENYILPYTQFKHLGVEYISPEPFAKLTVIMPIKKSLQTSNTFYILEGTTKRTQGERCVFMHQSSFKVSYKANFKEYPDFILFRVACQVSESNSQGKTDICGKNDLGSTELGMIFSQQHSQSK